MNGPTSVEAAILKAQFDYLERRADDLQRLASILLLFSTLFAAVAGISTYLNVNQAVERAGTLAESAEKHFSDARSRADSALERLDHMLSEVRAKADDEIAEIRREFPMFGYMNHVISRILAEFSALLDQDFLSSSSTGRVDLFNQLSPEKRQRVFFYEKSVAALAMMDMRAYSDEMSRIYRGLGLFFGSRAYSDANRVSESDLERAVFYFERANRVGTESAAIYNDMAFFMIDGRRPELWPRAEEILRRSLDLLDNQQRARLELSYIFVKRRDYSAAEQIAREALNRSSWETGNDPPRNDKMHYNCACALAGLGRLDEAVVHLEQAFIDIRRDLCDIVRADLASPDDEIQKLVTSELHGPSVTAIIKRCDIAFGRKPA
ncbi:MAG TPA: hypothetical protein VK335_27015 [Bryobacteraceae bacterium]|nr:hypothetical protein [Bryobacteraceae bacterium]